MNSKGRSLGGEFSHQLNVRNGRTPNLYGLCLLLLFFRLRFSSQTNCLVHGREFRDVIRFGQTRSELEIHALALHYVGPLLNLRMDRTDVFAEESNGNQLDRTEEKYTDHQGRDTDREVIPEQ